MAFIQCELESKSIHMPTSVYVILPRDREKTGNRERAVLYLLHGRGQGAASWMRYTSIERYAEEYNVAVVMPDAARSFFTDMRYGGAYFSYITKELPDMCEKLFGIDNTPASTYIMGLSMGGYGSLKCALSLPGQYAGCAAFSAVTDIKWRILETPADTFGYSELQAIFGTDLQAGDKDDLFALAKSAAAQPERPELLITCGTEDARCQQNKELSAYLKSVGYDNTHIEWQGDHTWSFWDESIQKALAHFFGSK